MAVNGNGFPPFDTRPRDQQINRAIDRGDLDRAGELLAPYETKARQQYLLKKRIDALGGQDIAKFAALTVKESIK